MDVDAPENGKTTERNRAELSQLTVKVARHYFSAVVAVALGSRVVVQAMCVSRGDESKSYNGTSLRNVERNQTRPRRETANASAICLEK